MNTPALHDATLLTIEMDWSSKVTTVMFRVATGETVRLTAEKTTSFHVPHVDPWGPSVSVNEMRQLKTGPRSALIELEMQSGDVIRIEAGQFGWS